SAQRFGVPMGLGGPHAAYIATTDKHKRRLPGRLVGVSKDAAGRPAMRLSLQTREQHIRRDKATSNICTAQVLLANIAGFYATYHGPKGLTEIAANIASATASIASALKDSGYRLRTGDSFFDTLLIDVDEAQREDIISKADALGFNLWTGTEAAIGLSIDETAIETGDWLKLATVFGTAPFITDGAPAIPEKLLRNQDELLPQPVFHQHHNETRMLRYLAELENRDIALNRSMIALGSCTMKLNATAEMMPLSWEGFGRLHPFAPAEQTQGYLKLADELESWLAEITGFSGVSLQPNAGSQGEYAGLLAIRRYHESRNDAHRNVCLIPTSAHGTNPASAVMAGMKVVPIRCDEDGNIDVDDIREKASKHADNLAALMITYPSTHGVFEEAVSEICQIIHDHGGQVYLDGANLNAQVGLCHPGGIGADVCHLNLHKTFCIPHGGGGPGVGPIGVAAHLVPFLPGHRYSGDSSGAVSAAPLGSASILTISWMYIAMMGANGLLESTRVAILSANYIAHRLKDYYPVLYRGKNGWVAHECILDLRPIKEESGIDVEDVAKRLIDYGFHAPTMSWPVPGTLMIEPTESEDLAELDRFCDAMIAIHGEIQQVQQGKMDSADNPLKRAPHPAEDLLCGEWTRSYSQQQGAFPVDWLRQNKYWPPVSRIDNVYGDRNLVCTCEGMDAYTEEE
ncbi:MAG: aminomethyl-transferring glycine dehydrogenase, partial [Verrucomicrobiota bacterium]